MGKKCKGEHFANFRSQLDAAFTASDTVRQRPDLSDEAKASVPSELKRAEDLWKAMLACDVCRKHWESMGP